MFTRTGFILIMLGLALAVSHPAFAEDMIHASIFPEQANLGDAVVYSVEIMTAGERQVSPDITLPEFTGLQSGEVFSKSSVTILNGKTYIRNTKEAHLIANSKGTINLAPAQVVVIDSLTRERRSLQSNPVSITVLEPTGAEALPTPTPVIDVLRPIKSSAHISFNQWFPYAVGLMVLGMIFGGAYYVRHRPKPAPPAPSEPADPRTPEQRAMDELEKAAVLKSEGKINEFYTRLTAILRRYMAESYQVKAEEATTREMLAMMEKMNFKPEFLELLRRYLAEADQVKYANVKPGSQAVEAALPATVALIKNPDKITAAAPAPEELPAAGGRDDSASEHSKEPRTP